MWQITFDVSLMIYIRSSSYGSWDWWGF